uniref:Uncharacterized protein n=1 Tax=Panagrolaimus superbus TaxID=310955 RepID=A0A914YCH2_9BILA
MDSPIKDRVTASVALKNKYAAFCSDDEGDASRIVDTDQIKKGEKTSVKKVPRNATTSTSSATKKLPNPEKSQTVTGILYKKIFFSQLMC